MGGEEDPRVSPSCDNDDGGGAGEGGAMGEYPNSRSDKYRRAMVAVVVVVCVAPEKAVVAAVVVKPLGVVAKKPKDPKDPSRRRRWRRTLHGWVVECGGEVSKEDNANVEELTAGIILELAVLSNEPCVRRSSSRCRDDENASTLRGCRGSGSGSASGSSPRGSSRCRRACIILTSDVRTSESEIAMCAAKHEATRSARSIQSDS